MIKKMAIMILLAAFLFSSTENVQTVPKGGDGIRTHKYQRGKIRYNWALAFEVLGL